MQAIDFHCDTLSRLREAEREGRPQSFSHNDFHIDLDKLKRGGYLMQCFAAFVYLGDRECSPLASALEQIDIFYRIMDQYPDAIRQVRNCEDLEQARREGKIGAMLTVEEGGACLGSIGVLNTLYRLGVRIMTLTWNFENELAYPNRMPGRVPGIVKSEAETEHGLKEKGFAFVEEMERLGMIVDVSHLSDAGFWDVARHAARPFIASHSNARAVCGHVRNLTDDMLRAVAEKGGITGINYCAAFLDGREDEENCFGTVAQMADHIEHIRQVGGLDMIALGSDFDGSGDNLELKDCSMVPLLADELHRRHYSDDAIEQIFSGNALRLFRDTLR